MMLQPMKTISSHEIDSDVEDIFYDPERKQIYLSCGGGYIDIFKQINPDQYELLATTSTYKGARTCLFISELNKLFLASPTSISQNATLSIYDVH